MKRHPGHWHIGACYLLNAVAIGFLESPLAARIADPSRLGDVREESKNLPHVEGSTKAPNIEPAPVPSDTPPKPDPPQSPFPVATPSTNDAYDQPLELPRCRHNPSFTKPINEKASASLIRRSVS